MQLYQSTRVAFYISGIGNPSVAICQLMKLHQGTVFIDSIVNSTEIVVHSKTNFRRSKSVIFPETIDAVLQLILQDRHIVRLRRP